MNIILVDDEQLSLDNLDYVVSRVLPGAHRVLFNRASAALAHIAANPVDIAFLDIEMRGTDGITIARTLREHNPRVNILFCTGYSRYSMDAWDLDVSGYLLKPITEQKIRHALENLRYPPVERKRVRLHCFGNFEAFCDEIPISFRYSRTRELLAYLADRNGVPCSMREISAVLFEDDQHRSYLYRLRMDLVNTLTALGAADILVQTRGRIGLCREKISCDYFDFLDGGPEPPVREYMAQYSFGEQTWGILFPDGEG